MHPQALFLSILVSILLSGCGEAGRQQTVGAADALDAAQGEEAGATSTDDPGRLEPLPPLGKRRPVDVSGYEQDQVRGLWRLSGVEDDDQTIGIIVSGGGCLYFSHMTVDALDGDAITLTAWNNEWTPEENYVCTSELAFRPFRVRFPEPVNGRRLDGQCSPGQATLAERQCPDGSFVTPLGH